jgi:hypothetical protein
MEISMPTLYSVIFLISCSLFASVSAAAEDNSAASTTPTEPSISAPQSTHARPISRNIAAAQAIQLGTEAQQLITLTTQREHFSALFLAANQAEPRGMLILLPGVGESFDWPTAIGPLRSKLPDAGWHTLSINLPTSPAPENTLQPIIARPVAEQIIIEPPVAPTPPAKEDSTDNEVEPTTEEAEAPEPTTDDVSSEPDNEVSAPESAAPPAKPLPPLTYPERINSFIVAAVNYAQQQQATEIILLGHHESAYWVLSYLAEQPSPTPLRVVLIAPRTNTQGHSSYENLISANASPIADFYYKGDRVTEIAAKQRLQASKRAGLDHYHQVGLTAVHPSLEQEQLFRRVKGWLNKP